MPNSFRSMLRNDLAAVINNPFGPADDVLLHSKEGGIFTIRGLFDAPGVDVTPSGASAPVSSMSPVLHFSQTTIETVLGRSLSNRDLVTVNGVKYKVVSPKPDGFGLISCKLLEAGDDF